ncbi:MAG: nitroreductase family protein [Ruminococcaceae bacterium]|nr:nitroreductase family protein [Oscillospiraceae bacterium]
MEIKECIETRRSTRKYAYALISEETIKDIVKAGQYAPSWKNSQTPRYYVALSDEARENVRALLPDFNKERTEGVGAFIITTVKKGRSGCDREGKYFSHLGNGFECFDNGLAVENMLLYAHSIGYSSLIMGLYDEAGLRAYLNVPSDEDLVVVIALGKKDIDPEMPERKTQDQVLKIF